MRFASQIAEMLTLPSQLMKGLQGAYTRIITEQPSAIPVRDEIDCSRLTATIASGSSPGLHTAPGPEPVRV